METNVIYCGDCKKVMMNHIPDESVELIYLDPPFFSNKKYEVIWGDGYEIRAFEDRWKGGIENYIAWMEDKLRECLRVLKPTGSIYLHCDYHAGHYLKVLMDEIFGKSNFRNEIIWQRTDNPKGSQFKSKKFGQVTDYILFYTKTNNYTFNLDVTRRQLSDEEVKSKYHRVDAKGRYYSGPVIRGPSMGERPNLVYKYKGFTPKIYGWRMTKKKLTELDKKGDLGWTSKNKPFRKLRPEDDKGEPMYNLWNDISRISATSSESEGYPTQKPESLLERIIKASSNPTDIVLDPTCGCGTAIAVAQKLGRRWIGIDVSPTGCKLMVKRMRKIGVDIYGKDIIGMPQTISQVKRLQPFEFQNWVCEKLIARPSRRKVGDMGIDGRLFDGTPMQVKQSEHVGRNVVDNFETAIRREKKKKGMIIALSFGKGAYEEVARAKNKDGLDIELKTVEEIMDEV